MNQDKIQNRFEQKSAQTRQDFRKGELGNLVREMRREHIKQFQQESEEQFKKFNLNLGMENIKQNLCKAHQYSTLDTYAYKMLSHCHLFLEALNELRGDKQAALMILEILYNLSQYQEFQIPGDKQTAILLNFLLQIYPDQILNLIENLSCNSYNFTELFVYLIEDGFLEKVKPLSKMPGIQSKSYGVLCGMVQSRPMLSLDAIAKIIQLIVSLQVAGEERLKFLEMLGSFSSLKPINDLAEILYKYVMPKCIQLYEEFTYQCLAFVGYLLKNPNINKKIPNSLIHSISQSALKGRSKEQAINTLNLLSQATQKSSTEMFGQQYFIQLLNLYWCEDISLKSSIIKALDYVARDRNTYKFYFSPAFIEIILDKLSEKSSKEAFETLQIMASILQHMEESQDQAHFIHPFKIIVEQLSNQPHQTPENSQLCLFLLEHEEP